VMFVAPDISAALKILQEKNRFLVFYFFRENILFKKSPLNIMVSMNPNWSTEIL